MDRISYVGDFLITGTDIARALLDYAQALAQENASATVEIPILADDGTRSRSEVLIGPASQLVSTAIESPYDEIVDEELVAYLLREAHRLRSYGIATPADLNDEDDSPSAGFSDIDF